MHPAIRVENVSKHFLVPHAAHRGRRGYRTLREELTRLASAPIRRARRIFHLPTTNGDDSEEDFTALEDVSFDVRPGEAVGIIGRNGAGKSTLLKILSRITAPTSGRVTLRGRVGSLLEVGTGFHQELTGHENIYLNGAILGMSRREIQRKFDEIVDFSGVEHFLDTPVKHYSSGMRVRLAFSVAAHLEPEIVLVDEVLAVGDAEFQAKCLGKMDNVARSGRTVIFVSHNMAAILSLCETIVLLERGRMIYKGESQAGIERYLKSGSASTGGEADLSEHPNRLSGRTPIIRHVRLLNGSGRPTDQFLSGKPIDIELLVDPSKANTDFNCGVQFEDTFGRRLFTVSTLLSHSACVSQERWQRLVCHLGCLPLAPGRYLLNFAAKSTADVQLDKIDQAISLDVTAGDYFGNGRLPNPNSGPFLVRSHWSATEA